MSFENIIPQVDALVALANETIKTEFQGDYAYSVGRAYIKVYDTDKKDNKARSVWCFINQAGQILKPASWKAPAKNFARGNLTDVLADGDIKGWRYGVS